MLVAVDPDTSGGIAVLSWTSQDVSSEVVSSQVVDSAAMSIRVFDMPVVLATLKKKSKVTKKQLTRR